MMALIVLLKSNTGELNVKANNITVQSDTGETFLTMDVNDGVDIFHDNVKKFETTSAGATVTGALMYLQLLLQLTLEILHLEI